MGNSCKNERRPIQLNPKSIHNSIIIIQKYTRRYQAQKKLIRLKIAHVFIQMEKQILKMMNIELVPFLNNDLTVKQCYSSGYQMTEVVKGQDKYYGQISNGYKEGLGLQRYPDHTYYIGQFQSNILCGLGRIVTSQSYYEGQFMGGQSNGKGKLVNHNGTIWEGSWIGGKLQGRGKEIQQNGCIYIGEFQDGIKQGKGQLVYQDGSQFNGWFINGRIDGQGQLINKDGSGYAGQWRGGLPHGQGVQTWNGGGSYQGEFKDGLRQGQGQYEWGNGQKYSGEWINGKQHGQGTTTYNGIQSEDQWSNGTKVYK